MDTRTLIFVDGFAGKLETLAAEMAAANFANDFKNGVPAVLRDIATDLKLQAREAERIPGGIRVEKIAAFAPRHMQAAAERPDVPDAIRKLFAAASVPLPAKGSTVAPATVDLIVRKSDLGPADRMAMKSRIEAAGLVEYAYEPMKARP